MNNYCRIHEIKDWNFELKEFNPIQKAYRLVAKNKSNSITEAMFIEPKYIESEELFKKECNRFYINCLSSFF